MTELDFEWDDKKADSNLAKHGISFLKAARIFGDPVLDGIDQSDKDGEVRYVAIGVAEEVVLRVTYTWRGDNTIRIISAWKANRRDKEKYYRQIYTQ